VFLILSFQLCICWNEQLLSRGLFFATARELTTSLVFLICNEIFVSGIS
jgi:hypothetical protein